MNCKFKAIEEPNAEGWRRVQCVRCGRLLHPTPSDLDKIYATCRVKGLGDGVAWLLSLVGITKSRVKALAGADCGCDGRQEVVNEAGWNIWTWLIAGWNSLCKLGKSQ